MFVKIPLIIGVVYLWIQTRNSFLAASVWGVAVLLVLLAFEGFSFITIAGAVVSFILCFGVFSLMDYLEGSGFQWLAGLIGIAILLLVA